MWLTGDERDEEYAAQEPDRDLHLRNGALSNHA